MVETAEGSVTNRGVPSVAFLGVAERYAHVADPQTNLSKWNILGLKSVVVSFVYPMTLNSFGLCFAFYQANSQQRQIIYLKDGRGQRGGSVDIAWQVKETGSSPRVEEQALRGEQWLMGVPWTFVVIPGDKIGLVTDPGTYGVFLADGDEEYNIGLLHFGLVEAEPLTAARIAALKSDPNAIKAVRLQVRCNKCGDEVRAYAGLERSPPSEAEQYVWYENLPDRFVCKCGAQNIGLGIARNNLHGLLGATGGAQASQTDIVALYEAGALHTVRRNFAALCEQDVPEETLQKFIEENPILLHPFAAQEIFFKSPILSLYRTDFTIINHQREMILVELENTSTKILKKDGGVHSELQHAFDQVTNWIHTCDEHRAAVVDSLKIDKGRVGAVRGVIIAGRDEGYDKEHLRILKGRDFGRISLLTYDDILAAFDALLKNIKSL